MKNIIIIVLSLMLITLFPSCKKDKNSTIPTEGLIAYYPFNGNAYDESGNGYDGTNFGAILTTDRFNSVNKAFSFADGTYISSTPPVPIGTAPRSVSAWFNTTSNSGSNGWYNNSIFSYGLPIQNNVFAAEVYQGIMLFDADGAGSSGFAILTDKVVSDGEWHHVVVTYNGTIVTLYLDSKEVGNITLQLATSNTPFCMGRRYNQESQYMDGYVDDVRIYNRTISQQEIETLYHEGGW